MFAQCIVLLIFFSENSKAATIIQSILSLVLFAGVIYTGYRFLSFVLGLMPLSQVLRYIANIFIGLYAGGIGMYLLRMGTLPQHSEPPTDFY